LEKNTIQINFKVSEHNGYPCIRILLNDQLLVDHQFVDTLWTYEFSLGNDVASHCLQIERYGKTDLNYSTEKDQTVEIVDITVDGIKVPTYILDKHSKFEFDTQVHMGSRYFGPNGVWTFNFVTPILTYILDEKILHEAQYNQDYKFAWSYKLGPDNVNNILSNISKVEHRLEKL
jgi:hypothetical protein